MKNTEAAFRWIVGILQEHQIPFQVTGGFAARLYGAKRDLVDIDFDIPENCFAELMPEVKEHVTFGPARHEDEYWDLFLLTLSYQGQNIDLGGAYETRAFVRDENKWVPIKANFSTAKLMEVYGVEVPVVNRQELVRYKKMLGREVDIVDIKQMNIPK